jgi:hypothetical protein
MLPQIEHLYISAFHILDSLPSLGMGKQDPSRLQTVLLKHFAGAQFEEGRITTNFAQVSHNIFLSTFIS